MLIACIIETWVACGGAVNRGGEDHFGGDAVRSVEVQSSTEVLRSGGGFSGGPCVAVMQQRCDKFEMPCASQRFSV